MAEWRIAPAKSFVFQFLFIFFFDKASLTEKFKKEFFMCVDLLFWLMAVHLIFFFSGVVLGGGDVGFKWGKRNNKKKAEQLVKQLGNC